VSPFWDDVDLRLAGDILYEVHTSMSEDPDPASVDLISQVSSYIQDETNSSFSGTWMIVVQWNMVHPWPHGETDINPIFFFFYPDHTEVSSATSSDH